MRKVISYILHCFSVFRLITYAILPPGWGDGEGRQAKTTELPLPSSLVARGKQNPFRALFYGRKQHCPGPGDCPVTSQLGNGTWKHFWLQGESTMGSFCEELPQKQMVVPRE